MDTVKKEKIIQDARNMFIIAIYSLQVRLRPQLLRTSYTILLPKKTICNGKTICTVNFHIIHAAVLISFLYLFTFWLLPKCGWPSGLDAPPLAVVGQPPAWLLWLHS